MTYKLQEFKQIRVYFPLAQQDNLLCHHCPFYGTQADGVTTINHCQSWWYKGGSLNRNPVLEIKVTQTLQLAAHVARRGHMAPPKEVKNNDTVLPDNSPNSLVCSLGGY
jgi:hypothetical protein